MCGCRLHSRICAYIRTMVVAILNITETHGDQTGKWNERILGASWLFQQRTCAQNPRTSVQPGFKVCMRSERVRISNDFQKDSSSYIPWLHPLYESRLLLCLSNHTQRGYIGLCLMKHSTQQKCLSLTCPERPARSCGHLYVEAMQMCVWSNRSLTGFRFRDYKQLIHTHTTVAWESATSDACSWQHNRRRFGCSFYIHHVIVAPQISL